MADSLQQRTWATPVGLACFAAALTAVHWLIVDSNPENERWQREMYADILAGTASVPHQYRPLPYFVTRLLEIVCGNWLVACLLYRWLFTWAFLGCWYRFARLFHGSRRAWASLLVLVPLYPLSVCFYRGQLTDPMSHWLFALALVYVVEDRWVALAVVLAVGVLAKETIVVLVPGYLACYVRSGWAVISRCVVLTAAAVLAFLAVRLPYGWGPGYQQINGTEELMMASNLGVGHVLYVSGVPLYQNYLQPALFIGIFIPLLWRRWPDLDGRLKALLVTVPPLVLASSVCFSWLYESRNYVPLLPLLTTACVVPGRRPKAV